MLKLPPHAPGQRIGLFGGSFNPPHLGHRHVSLTALKRVRLDLVWWLVTPGNPLKNVDQLPDLTSRIAAAQKLAGHPKLIATGIEAEIKTVFTVDTLKIITRRSPKTRFFWIMGADNLSQFHLWKGWRDIAASVPMVIIDRPGFTQKALHSPAAQALMRWRVPEITATTFAARAKNKRTPSWIFLHGKRSPLSSTLLRKRIISRV
jgi:nicotinate-nucleotide adenylyltransferase